MSKNSKRQDYVARIRYSNDLPPPPCPPKLLKIPVDTQKLTSSAFLSDALVKRKMNMQVDSDLGMPLDLLEVPKVLSEGDESAFFANDEQTTIPLPEEDKPLLEDPTAKNQNSKTGPASVAFLRRTEYMSEAMRQKSNETKASSMAQQKAEKVNPEVILQTVESTFDTANTNITTLRHPRKKHLRPAKSWALLPDTKMFDLQYISVKMVGSASLSNQKRKFSDAELSTALFKQSSVGEDEWMSFYTAEDKDAEELKERVESSADTLEEDSRQYRFTRIQDNDVTLEKKRQEITLNFDQNTQQALYTNVAGQASLKRRRVVKHRREQVDENNVAQIDLTLREISTEESNARDESRAEFDSVNYGSN